MNIDLSTIIWMLLALMALQPLLAGRRLSMKRAGAIRAIQRSRRSRVITNPSAGEVHVGGWALDARLRLDGNRGGRAWSTGSGEYAARSYRTHETLSATGVALRS